MARSDGLPASEYAAMKRQARENESAQREFHQSAMRDQGLDPETGQPSSGPTTSTPRSQRPPWFVPQVVHNFTTGSAGGSVAGAMLGALAFFTGRAYIQGGWTGVRAFYAAKFLNRTSAQPNPIPVTTAASATTLPVNNAAGGGAAASSPSTSSGSALGAGQTPSGAPAVVGSRVKQSVG
jgi:hypothetical protein